MEEAKKPRILLVADYSNFHATLAKGLRRLGCDVTLVSDGSTFMQCDRDIDISRRFEGKVGGFLHASNLLFSKLPKMRGFDIVSFRDPQFLSLRPERIKWFFKQIVKANKACYLSYITTDVNFLDMLEAKDSPLKYSEWFIDGKPNRLRLQDTAQWDGWHAKEMKDLNEFFYRNIKGAVTGLYEYQVAAERIFPKERIAYGGIPIDVDAIPHKIIDRPRKIRFFLARDQRRKLEKGNDLMELAARNVAAKFPDKAEIVVVENVPRHSYLEAMRSCHVMLDQMYSYTPATMALEGMASGLTVVSGSERDFYDFIGEKSNFPLINSPTNLESLEKCIENLISNPGGFRERAIKGREFVAKHNGVDTVARRFYNFWMHNA